MQSLNSKTNGRPSWHYKWVLYPSVLVFCGVAYWVTTQFDRVPPILKRGIQPSDFPQLIIGLIAVLTLVVFVKDKDEMPEPINGTGFLTFVLLIGFVLISQIDLFLGLGLFSGALCALWGERRIWALSLVSIIMPIAIFFLFDLVFTVRFPKGILTNIWYG